MSDKESILLKHQHILLYIDQQLINLENSYSKEFEYVKNNFCGLVFCDIESFINYNCNHNAIIYMCGDIDNNYDKIRSIESKSINVIKEFSYNYCNLEHYELINIGQVPINIYNVGIYFRNLFSSCKDYFNLISNAHQFQALTESNKLSNAFRTGIYLTKVEEIDDGFKFKLLRCSSNLDGPTDNFRDCDNEIVNRVNNLAGQFFEENAELNHVLAQIYENKIVNINTKNVERKAKIKAHSDKTKDMPKNGLIAFCTFYKNYCDDKFNSTDMNNIKKSKNDLYDYCYKNVSVLTKMRFKLKKMVNDSTLMKSFDITLYPNSVFIIPLSTNRLYTHEIIPSVLQIDKIPVRLGYVIRCSNTEAVFKNNQTYINENGNSIKLEDPNTEGIKELKDLYFKENITNDTIHYNKFNFSLNNGDYKKPII